MKTFKGIERVKCSGCRKWLAQERFSPSNWARGTGVWCRTCNTARVNAYNKRRRAEARP